MHLCRYLYNSDRGQFVIYPRQNTIRESKFDSDSRVLRDRHCGFRVWISSLGRGYLGLCRPTDSWEELFEAVSRASHRSDEYNEARFYRNKR